MQLTECVRLVWLVVDYKQCCGSRKSQSIWASCALASCCIIAQLDHSSSNNIIAASCRVTGGSNIMLQGSKFPGLTCLGCTGR